jgi:SnoaL-like domain
MATELQQDELRLMADKIAIREVLDRYWAGEDRCDPDIVCSAFAEDAEYGGGKGLDHIRSVMKGLEAYAGMHHVISSQLIEVDGDTAIADTMALGFCQTKPESEGGSRVLVRGLRYRDEMVRTDDGWKILRRGGFGGGGHDTPWQADLSVVPYWGPHSPHA